MISTSTSTTTPCMVINRPNPNPNPNKNAKSCPSWLAVSALTSTSTSTSTSIGRRRRSNISCCQVATTASEEEQVTMGAADKIGRKIRVVKAPLKVYHVPRVPEGIDLSGMEGVVNRYVGVWKGKRISANLPYKVEFHTQIQGRGSLKFFAHLKDDEFHFLD
ncbi:FeThRed_A domain-containing protein [Cephalotus follicularis]|uniref:FeThRed_A domain-containing protein n=1 Tax=Cephalotus follicularis TaxID=3775 RepID=A0A1Q3D362_CEPFO|nr:FeThRed_A domain-containing protein [Cephalotus follicularis]